MNKFKHLTTSLVSILIVFSPLLVLAENQPSLGQNDIFKSIVSKTLDIGWASDQPEPVRWRVLAVDRADQPEWFSLQAPTTGNEPLTRHLRLQGQLAGQRLASTGHLLNSGPERVSRQLIFQRILAGSGLLLEQIYQATDEPYRLSFDIKLQNSNNKTFEPLEGDYLILLLGPGLGNQQVEGLGYAESLYSFIEPVALEKDEVQIIRPETIAPVTAPWNGFNLMWFGLHGRYFALLLAPIDASLKQTKFSSELVQTYLVEDIASELKPESLPVLSISLPIYPIKPNESIQWRFIVFSGPKSFQALHDGAQSFDQLMFPGLWQWMRWLSFGLIWVLDMIHNVLPNWGLAILLLAVLVRIAMYPIAKNALVKQKEFLEIQRRMQPKLQAIKMEYHGGEQSERILQLYEQYGISPLAGLKPLLIVLIQLPILVSLFHVLGSAYELHDAKFLWINTLAEPDKLFNLGFSIPLLGEYFNVLPVLMALSTLAVLKLSPASASDPATQRHQNIFLIIMALGFFLLFYPFPSGMVLYWTAANLLQIIQQRFFTKTVGISLMK